MSHRFALFTVILLLHFMVTANTAEATLPRFLRTGGDGMRTRINSDTRGIIYGSTPSDSASYDSGWVDSDLGDATAAIGAGGVSGFATTDSAIDVGLDGQTLISTPSLAHGVIILERNGPGVVDGGIDVLTEWDVEWIVDDENGIRDYSHEYTVTCEISFSRAAGADGNGPTMESVVLPSDAGYTATKKYAGLFIKIQAGSETIEIYYDEGNDEWVTDDGVVSLEYSNDGNVNISVSKAVVLSHGESVTITGEMGYSESIATADTLVESAYSLTVDAKLIP